jgi:hypothetical protein
LAGSHDPPYAANHDKTSYWGIRHAAFLDAKSHHGRREGCTKEEGEGDAC